MDTQTFVEERVHTYYWDYDLNCATTTLKILSEKFGIALCNQVIDSALGMHGAGEYGAQCGLVEGALMFIGIISKFYQLPDEMIISYCHEYAQRFEKQFESLICKILRPEGFHPDNPPHLCERLTCEAIAFDIDFISNFLKIPQSTNNNI